MPLLLLLQEFFATVVFTSRIVTAAMSDTAEVPLDKFKSAAADIAAATILKVMTTVVTIHEVTVTVARIIRL